MTDVSKCWCGNDADPEVGYVLLDDGDAENGPRPDGPDLGAFCSADHRAEFEDERERFDEEIADFFDEPEARFDVIVVVVGSNGTTAEKHRNVDYAERNRLVDFAFRHGFRYTATAADPRPDRPTYR